YGCGQDPSAGVPRNGHAEKSRPVLSGGRAENANAAAPAHSLFERSFDMWLSAQRRQPFIEYNSRLTGHEYLPFGLSRRRRRDYRERQGAIRQICKLGGCRSLDGFVIIVILLNR